ncbi:unnamed protein product, partial [Oikopleura dioica]
KPAPKQNAPQTTPSQVATTMKDSLFFYDPEDDSSDDENIAENEESNTSLVREEMSHYETFYSKKKDEKWRSENRKDINEESQLLDKFWRDNKSRFPLMSKIALQTINLRSTSSEVERDFSTMSYDMGPSKSNTKAATLGEVRQQATSIKFKKLIKKLQKSENISPAL